uniref:uncharacterized protein LOC114590734 n=1 Tax=Podarcis muralis TaxID=64176 RepID=UPI00109FFF65|nr:uncharacterized protein LOC114590734 [Podarcis muralis]
MNTNNASPTRTPVPPLPLMSSRIPRSSQRVLNLPNGTNCLVHRPPSLMIHNRCGLGLSHGLRHLGLGRGGGKATSKSTRNNNPAAPSSSNRSQDKRPRAQSPDSEASSAAEDAQQEEEGAAAATAEKPSGKRREKKKHTCRKSRSRRDDSDDDTDSSFPVARTWSTTVARTLSGVPVECWRRKVIQGVLASVAPSTLRSYKKAWCDFLGFRFGLSGLSHNTPPPPLMTSCSTCPIWMTSDVLRKP